MVANGKRGLINFEENRLQYEEDNITLRKRRWLREGEDGYEEEKLDMWKRGALWGSENCYE